MRDAHYRSLIKALSWRLTGTIDTTILAFIITRQIKWAISIGLVEIVTKTILYYLHERLWNKISIGRKPERNDNYVI